MNPVVGVAIGEITDGEVDGESKPHLRVVDRGEAFVEASSSRSVGASTDEHGRGADGAFLKQGRDEVVPSTTRSAPKNPVFLSGRPPSSISLIGEETKPHSG
jgi:hypothetical protein